MKQVNIFLLGALMSLVFFLSCKETSSELSLAGEWQFALDPADAGIGQEWQKKGLADVVRLPGSLQEQGKGDDVSLDTRWTGQVVDSSWYNAPEYAKYRQPGNIKVPFWLNPDKHYVGVAWYQKKVNVPSGWENRPVVFSLERTHWATTLFLDGRKVGEQNSLQTPHRYLLEGLDAGEHTLTLRVDNRLYADVGINAHSVSDHTQSNWNGIIGDMKLSAKPSLYIGSVRIYPDIKKKQALVKVQLKGNTGKGTTTVVMQAETLEGKTVGNPVRFAVEAGEGAPAHAEATVDLGEEARLWSEHSPNVYKMKVSLESPDGIDEASYNFGFREFKANGTRFEINGQPVFLRGTLECCIFPLTGYPAMQNDYWAKIYRTCKEYGLNHVRFHSWCPPEACFEAADIEGIYLQPELPVWGNIDIDDTELCDYLLKEGRNLHRAYSNHASFVMFGLGNEMSGEEGLAMLIQTFKKEDNRHIYASGSNNYLGFKGKQADEDYFTTCRVGREDDKQFNTHARASFSFADAYDGGYLNHTYPNSEMDFSSANALCDVPIISHETGQFQVYPNYEEIKKYTGVLKPRNFEIFKKRLEEAGMIDQAHDFMMASGKWSALLYRADIEMNLRTPEWGGFQLLDLQDYPGQGSAYVGILDAFMESKGLITPEEWRHFCSEVVPLFCTEKFCWTNDEALTGEVEIANYSESDLNGKQLSWVLTDSKQQVLDKGVLPLQVKQGELAKVGTLKSAIASVRKAEKVTLALSIDGTPYRNDYSLWIYPADKEVAPSEDICVTDDLDAHLKYLTEGGKVLWFPSKDKHKDQTVGGLFQTDYWNYRMFRTICENLDRPVSPGTLGILTDPGHPALADFPTEFHTNWQWFPIIKQSYPMILDRLSDDYRPIVQIIDNVERNHKLGLLFEFKVGNGKLLVCMSDLKAVQDKPEARQFYRSILEYIPCFRTVLLLIR